jgi:hypothetical protein
VGGTCTKVTGTPERCPDGGLPDALPGVGAGVALVDTDVWVVVFGCLDFVCFLVDLLDFGFDEFPIF